MSAYTYGNPGLTKAYSAEAEVLPNKFVKFGTAEGTYVLAAAASDALIGVSAPDRTIAIGETGDVIHSGIAIVTAGGTITRGALVTSDAAGVAVASSSYGNRIGGVALTSAVDGDLFPVLLTHGLA